MISIVYTTSEKKDIRHIKRKTGGMCYEEGTIRILGLFPGHQGNERYGE